MAVIINLISQALDFLASLWSGAQTAFNGFFTTFSTITATITALTGVSPTFITNFTYSVITLAGAALVVKIIPFIG